MFKYVDMRLATRITLLRNVVNRALFSLNALTIMYASSSKEMPLGLTATNRTDHPIPRPSTIYGARHWAPQGYRPLLGNFVLIDFPSHHHHHRRQLSRCLFVCWVTEITSGPSTLFRRQHRPESPPGPSERMASKILL